MARVPAFPGAGEIVHTALIFRYDPLRRGFVEVYRAATPGRIPLSVDAVRADSRSGGRPLHRPQ